MKALPTPQEYGLYPMDANEYFQKKNSIWQIWVTYVTHQQKKQHLWRGAFI